MYIIVYTILKTEFTIGDIMNRILMNKRIYRRGVGIILEFVVVVVILSTLEDICRNKYIKKLTIYQW